MHDRTFRPIMPILPIPTKPVPSPAPKRAGRTGLYVRFVVRMSGDLSAAIGSAARRDGLTAGAWVRRLLLERLDLRSAADARSGRPVRVPEAQQAAVAAALRELAKASAAAAEEDRATTLDAIQAARSLLIPVALRRSAS